MPPAPARNVDVKQAPPCLVTRLLDSSPEDDESEGVMSMACKMSTCCIGSTIDRALRRVNTVQPDGPDPDGSIAELLSALLSRPVYPDTVRRRRLLVEDVLRPQVRALMADAGIPQRTPPWYEARQTMITASDIAQALGCAKFGTQKQFFVKKCGRAEEQKEFDGSLPPLKWGVMFESAANGVYKALNGVRLNEFGLLRHPTVPFLGASPDGITDDGVMVEIKCPWRRKITGEVPLQYYYQIQGQLEVTGLQDCDYFECEFAEVPDEREADAKAGLNASWARGVFLETVVTLACGKTDSVYRYPAANVREQGTAALRVWVNGQTALELEHDGCVLVREHWWVLSSYCTVRVEKDPALIARMLPELEGVWNRVLRYRADRAAYEAEVISPGQKGDVPEPDKKNCNDKRKSRAKAAGPQASAKYAFIDDNDEATPGWG